MREMTPDSIEWVDSDGWRLPLRRYVGGGAPVLLLHGLGANHLNWDATECVSLAHFLCQRGWDVWVVVLPGDAASVAPEDAWPVYVDDLVDVHLPAVVEHVLAVTGSTVWFGVGHSLGGKLLLASLERGPAAVVTVCSATVFEEPSWLVRWGAGLRAGGGAAGVARWWAWSAGFNPVVRLLANPRNMEAAVLRLLAHRAVDDGAPTVAAQVRGWMRSGEMVDRHGVALVNYGCDVPVLMVGAGLDLLVSAEDVQRTAERLPGAEYHHLAAFGHLDPVLGRTARQEVYPIVQAFLARFQ